MASTTRIPWADSTASPWLGCDKVSAGCKNCYIVNATPLRSVDYQHGQPRIKTKTFEANVKAMNRKPWICDNCGAARSARGHERSISLCLCGASNANAHKRRIFPSLCDWLDPDVPAEWLAHYLKVINAARDLDHLLLTKRPHLYKPRLLAARATLKNAIVPADVATFHFINSWLDGYAPGNVVTGVTIEDENNDWRAEYLAAIPAKGWFISYEPALGPVNWPAAFSYWNTEQRRRLLWIAGGESGKKARPCNVEWIRAGLNEARNWNVVPFVKQLGAFAYCGEDLPAGWKPKHGIDAEKLIVNGSGFPLKDPNGRDVEEWPADLRVREMPKLD